ncbi:MAG: endonuclease III domain-containing protein [Dehalococcoidia bacterium]|nr:endonuclease III domain-containing protein [Dehalococcoidia bacterium]
MGTQTTPYVRRRLAILSLSKLQYGQERLPDGLNSLSARLLSLFELLFRRYGPQHWWPGDSPFEVIVGAILTQSASWGNVEKAVNSLKHAGALSPASLRDLPLTELAQLIYPSGYYNAKALKLKAFAEHLGEEYGDSLDSLFSLEIPDLREELLGIHGIGPETADSIILYAAYKPVFVIDAYTRRVISRLGLAPLRDTYDSYQALFMEHLPPDSALFNEYHALFVRHGKDTCRKRPDCAACCLRDHCANPQD